MSLPTNTGCCVPLLIGLTGVVFSIAAIILYLASIGRGKDLGIEPRYLIVSGLCSATTCRISARYGDAGDNGLIVLTAMCMAG